MIIKDVNNIIGTEREVDWGNGKSRRFLLESDGMGYSFTETLVKAGSSSRLEYRNHLETCYCISGEGEVRTMSGESYPIKPGVMYALDEHDEHFLVASEQEDMKLVCVFNPPLSGAESHSLDGDGSSSY